jgi:hypothetical protein
MKGAEVGRGVGVVKLDVQNVRQMYKDVRQIRP